MSAAPLDRLRIAKRGVCGQNQARGDAWARGVRGHGARRAWALSFLRPDSTGRARAARWRLCVATLALLSSACVDERRRPLKPEQDMYDPNPTRRAQAVGELGRMARPDQVPLLIEALDDQDEAVRLAAGRALKDLTGHDTGYRAYAEPSERRRQVDAWRAWYAGQAPAGAGGR